jgi:hypothetical protein
VRLGHGGTMEQTGVIQEEEEEEEEENKVL